MQVAELGVIRVNWQDVDIIPFPIDLFSLLSYDIQQILY